MESTCQSLEMKLLRASPSARSQDNLPASVGRFSCNESPAPAYLRDNSFCNVTIFDSNDPYDEPERKSRDEGFRICGKNCVSRTE